MAIDNKNLKFVHQFTIEKEVEVDDTVITKDEKGAEVKTIKKVKKNIPITLGLRKPTRTMQDNADLFYNVQIGQAVKAGVLTRAMMLKYIKNVDGVLSEKEKDTYVKLTEELFDASKKRAAILDKKETARTKEETEEFEKLTERIRVLSSDLTDFQYEQQELFNNTAENLAKSKTIAWWMVYLSCVKDEKNLWSEFFGEGALDSRLDKYETMINEENPFNLKAIQKLILYTTLWFSGNAVESKDFEEFDKSLNK